MKKKLKVQIEQVEMTTDAEKRNLQRGCYLLEYLVRCGYLENEDGIDWPYVYGVLDKDLGRIRQGSRVYIEYRCENDVDYLDIHSLSPEDTKWYADLNQIYGERIFYIQDKDDIDVSEDAPYYPQACELAKRVKFDVYIFSPAFVKIN